MVRQMRKGVKAAIITVVCLVVVGAILVGVFWYLGRSTEPVAVRPVSMLNAGYFGNEVGSGGYVTTDKLQSVYASATQTVTQVFVTEGQNVKKGDPLLSYDTTLSDIQLQRQRIAVQQAELNLNNAKKELKEINAMKPYTPPPPTEPPTEPTEPPTEPLEPVPEDQMPYLIGGSGTAEQPYRYLCVAGMVYDREFLEGLLGENESIHVLFEVRESNAVKGEALSRVGLVLSRDAETTALQFSMFVPPAEPVVEIPPVTVPDSGGSEWVDDSSGFTSAEIAQMRAEKQREIRDLDLALRVSKIELSRMQNEVENGTVYATIDGQVMQVLDTETALTENSPVMIVSGGGCYYIKATLSEYDLQRFPVGSQVRVNSWRSGTETYGTIEEILETPTNNNDYYGQYVPSASYFTALIAVDAGASLLEGEYLNVTYSSQRDQSNVLCLENMYLRTENGRTYVYKRGEDGKLHKCYVETGDMYWGSYTEVLSGLTEEDWIAFPYGKDVKDGAETVEDEDMGGGMFYGY